MLPGQNTLPSRAVFALYLVPMEPVKPPSKPDNTEVVTRRNFGGKLVWVPPAVLAVVNAAQRPALAQSGDLTGGLQ